MTLTNPKNNETINSGFSNEDAIAFLRNNMEKVNNSSREFAKSLCSYRVDRMSDTQLFWVHKLATAISHPAPQKQVRKVGDFDKVLQMVRHAYDTGAKRLKIRLILSDGRKISLCPFAPKGELVAVYINDPEVPYNEYGRITPSGDLLPGRGKCKVDPEVFEVIKRFAADPLGVAKEYGNATGNCCFCGLELTVDRSVDLGWGPQCARKYGLEVPY